MQLEIIDWLIVAAYLIFALGVGIFFMGRAGKSSEQYYLAGRSLPWWILGTSMVATTFAADTPLAITEMSRSKGIWENWFWWNWLLYGLLAVFLFARLWRRANVLTENELLELRYSGRPAAFLRFFKAGYFALLYNFIVMAWVINGMSAVLSVMLGQQDVIIPWFGGNLVLEMQTAMIWLLVVIAVVYSLLSGFWGVVITDVVQFVIAMVGSVTLAVIALNHVGGPVGLQQKLDQQLAENHEQWTAEIAGLQSQLDSSSSRSATESNQDATNRTDAGGQAEVVEQENPQELQQRLDQLTQRQQQAPRTAAEAISVVPPWPTGVPLLSFDFLNSKFFQFLVLVLVMWWSNHSTDGGGYLIQRTMAARDEHHALAANLWYNFANFALRTWPWVIVALVSIVMFPDLSNQELGEKAGYPMVMQKLLGPGLRGLLLVSFLAAFMSTIDTHLNWASSYLVHDVYRRFLYPANSDSHYVLVGRMITVTLMVLAAVIALYMGSIEKAWKFVMAMGGGIGLVLILRWFWWRINAWTEITALLVSVLVTCGFELLAAVQTVNAGQEYVLFSTDPTVWGEPFPFHLQLLVVVAVSLMSWVAVTFLTAPEPQQLLVKFYERVQPGGWWGPVRAEAKTATLPAVLKGFWLNFVAGLAFVWGGMFCLGYLIFGNWLWSGISAALFGNDCWLYHYLAKLSASPIDI